MKKSKHVVISLILILFIAIYYFTYTFIQKNYSQKYDFLPNNIWSVLWTLLLMAIFSFSKIKIKKDPVKRKVNFSYLLLALCMLTMYIPNTPLFKIYALGKGEILLLIFWFGLFHTLELE
jgi:uncharacterized membrane protein